MSHPRPAIWLVLALAPLSTAWAGGTVRGVVRVAGSAIRRPAVPVAKDTSVCGHEVPDETLEVGADGGLANVVVSVDSDEAPPAAATAIVDQVGCRYVPHVLAVPLGVRLSLVNSDGVLHNVHATLLRAGQTVTAFNVAMPFKGQRLPALLKHPGVHRLQCDAGHTWMNAYVVVFAHPHFAVTDPRGAFVLEGLAPGPHTLQLWHEPVGGKGNPVVRTLAVRVTEGQVSEVQTIFHL